MVMTREERQKTVGDFAKHEKDTGSCEVQIALLTERIRYLTEHLKHHRNDKHTRRGLELMVSRRNRLLKYLRNNDFTIYRSVIGRLGLRK